jgi:hypothetical protein
MNRSPVVSSKTWNLVVDAGRRLLLQLDDEQCSVNVAAAADSVLRRFSAVRDSARLRTLLIEDMEAFARSIANARRLGQRRRRFDLSPDLQ